MLGVLGRPLQDEVSASLKENKKSGMQRDLDCSSGDAVAARNGLWVTLRCRPYCAAAIKPEYTSWTASTCCFFQDFS